MKTFNKTSKVKPIKVEALLSGMGYNPAWEIKDKDAEKVLEIYNSMPQSSFVNTRKELNRLYSGCMLEISSGKNIHVFDGYAILNENNVIEVRLDKNQLLEKQLLKHLQAAPMVKNLIFNSELSRDVEINKAV
jgi:hypothetical protein